MVERVVIGGVKTRRGYLTKGRQPLQNKKNSFFIPLIKILLIENQFIMYP